MIFHNVIFAKKRKFSPCSANELSSRHFFFSFPRFKRHHTLRGHIYKYHADRKFECNKCGRKLQSQVSLSRHMQIMHDPTRVKKSRAKPKPAFKTFQ